MQDSRLAEAPQAGLFTTLAVAAYVATPLYVAPALAALYVSQLHFRPDDAGYIIAAEMAGMGAATFPALWWLRRLDWGLLTRCSLLLIAAGDAVSMLAGTSGTLAGMRFLSGLAEGTVSIVCMSRLRLARDPNRSFALWLFAQLLAGSAGLAMLPALARLYGVAGFFAVAGILAVGLVWPVGIFRGDQQPAAAREPPSVAAAGMAVSSRALSGRALSSGAVLGLCALMAFYVSFSCIWTFVAEIARAHGLAGEATGYALSLAPVGGMLGAALAAAIGARFGKIWPLAMGMLILGAAIWTLADLTSVGCYTSAVMALMFGWTFVVPQLIGGLAAIDPTGRVTVTVNVIIGAALAAGPAAGALVLAGRGNYKSVAAVALGLCVASFLLAIPLLKATRSVPRAAEPAAPLQ